MLGIKKNELWTDYYMDELYEVIAEHNDMNRYEPKGESDEITEVDEGEFFGF